VWEAYWYFDVGKYDVVQFINTWCANEKDALNPGSFTYELLLL